MKIYDYIVVGSGCSGAMAAQTLVEGGKQVAMLDVGYTAPKYDALIPKKDFITIRRSETNQSTYFVGDKSEGLVWGDIGKGAQITPSRGHISKSTRLYLPVSSSSFSPLESLGYGGLGIGWGLQCWEYSTRDLQTIGLDPQSMYKAYETVARRIGISATEDDAKPYTLNQLKSYQPSIMMDQNHKRIYKNYLKKKEELNARGFVLGRTPLALLTKDLHGRKKYAYRDMDFYSDQDKSGWRPWMTVNELKKHQNFTYIENQLVLRFKDNGEYVAVYCLDISNSKSTVFNCRKLVLASGCLGTARIVLRTQANNSIKLPLLCNPYTYIPSIQPTMVGAAAETNKTGLAQLSLFLQEQSSDLSVASLYSYQSLMLFRIIRQLPLNFFDARKITQYLASGLIIVGVHHPDRPSPDKYLQLQKSQNTPTGDKLRISYSLQKNELSEFKRREKKYIKALRMVGVYALKRINPGHGSSVHYAGTLPYSKVDKAYTISPEGRLHGTKNVYIADSSGFQYLPAQGLTFTLMANAHLTAERLLKL